MTWEVPETLRILEWGSASCKAVCCVPGTGWDCIYIHPDFVPLLYLFQSSLLPLTHPAISSSLQDGLLLTLSQNFVQQEGTWILVSAHERRVLNTHLAAALSSKDTGLSLTSYLRPKISILVQLKRFAAYHLQRIRINLPGYGRCP